MGKKKVSVEGVVLLCFGVVLGLLMGQINSSRAGNITATGMYQGDLYTYLSNVSTLVNELQTDHATNRTAVANLKTALGNQLLSDANVAIGSTTSKVNLTSPITFLVDGAVYTAPLKNDFWTLAGTAITSNSANVYLLAIDSSNTYSVLEGTEATTVAGITYPSLPSSLCVVGSVIVSTSATFTPGTTALDAGTVTDTYFTGLPPTLIGDPAATLSASTALSLTGL